MNLSNQQTAPRNIEQQQEIYDWEDTAYNEFVYRRGLETEFANKTFDN